ncbi:PepSY domain-containing protein [Streptomyces sp. NPDC088785]|uniref:PepSY domain-containing protein n=1 Tax=Streptomyces sp. NPDC088785 TaxID=3365897 RepID=UPI003811CFC1
MIGMTQIESDEARRIVETELVLPAGDLLDIAEARHPGGQGALGLEFGRYEGSTDRYLFSTTVEDEEGAVWHLLLDAHSGEVVQDVAADQEQQDGQDDGRIVPGVRVIGDGAGPHASA